MVETAEVQSSRRQTSAVDSSTSAAEPPADGEANETPAASPGPKPSAAPDAPSGLSASLPLMPPESFFEAAAGGNVDAVKSGLRQGLDADMIGEGNRTALQLAAFDGHTEIVRMLLDKKVTVDHRDEAGRTALMYASTANNVDTVKLLLRSGANPNLADNEENFTPLMFAAAEGVTGVVRLLLDAGAKPDHRDIDGESAADFAANNGHTAVVELLKSESSK